VLPAAFYRHVRDIFVSAIKARAVRPVSRSD